MPRAPIFCPIGTHSYPYSHSPAMTTAALRAHAGAESRLGVGLTSQPPKHRTRVDADDRRSIETMEDNALQRREMRKRWRTAGDLLFGTRLGEESKAWTR